MNNLESKLYRSWVDVNDYGSTCIGVIFKLQSNRSEIVAVEKGMVIDSSDNDSGSFIKMFSRLDKKLGLVLG